MSASKDDTIFTTDEPINPKTKEKVEEPWPIVRHYCCEIEKLTTKIHRGKYKSSEELFKLCEKIKKFANGIEEFQRIQNIN
jgi:hypothetical protein